MMKLVQLKLAWKLPQLELPLKDACKNRVRGQGASLVWMVKMHSKCCSSSEGSKSFLWFDDPFNSSQNANLQERRECVFSVW